MNTNEFPVGHGVGGDSGLVLPSNTPSVRFKNIVTGRTVEAAEQGGKMRLALREIFANFSVALLETTFGKFRQME